MPRLGHGGEVRLHLTDPLLDCCWYVADRSLIKQTELHIVVTSKTRDCFAGRHTSIARWPSNSWPMFILDRTRLPTTVRIFFLPGPCLLSYSVFVFSFFSNFFVSVPYARLDWPSRQLLNARKYTASYRIVSYFRLWFVEWLIVAGAK